MTTEPELRHLLEMAAKACGYMPNNNWRWSQRAGTDGAFRYRIGGDWGEWAPHTDDGDSARMRTALRMNVIWSDTAVHCICSTADAFESIFNDTDRNAALRLCALRVAAAIGENTQ